MTVCLNQGLERMDAPGYRRVRYVDSRMKVIQDEMAGEKSGRRILNVKNE
jgi:hypothetical protein